MTFLQQDLEQPVTYLDNSSTTQPCPTAVSRMTAALTEGWGNPSSLHRLGMVAQLEMDAARWLLAEKLSCKPAEVYFTAVGIGSADDPLTFDPRTFTCQGADTATVQVRDDGGQLLNYAVSCQADGRGVRFTAQPAPVPE